MVVDRDFSVTTEKLGEGSFGSVWKACLPMGRRPNVAYKKLSKMSKPQMKAFDLEVDILKLLKHPNVVRIFGTSRSESVHCARRSNIGQANAAVT